MKESIKSNKDKDTDFTYDIKSKNRVIEVNKYSRKLKEQEKDFKSENRLINIKNEIDIKESVQENLNEEKDEEKINEENNNPQENKKNIFSRALESISPKFLNFNFYKILWFSNAFKEVSLLWKSEELVDAYDANGNLVKRPKNKIPTKNSKKDIDPVEEKISDNAKSETFNYAHDNISYGALFN